MAVTVIKSAITFGILCRFPGCVEFRVILDHMQFPGTKPRRFAPTAAQIISARKAAHAAGAPSRAFAYALQFETTLRQWDVVGQWIPLSDKRASSLLGYGEKWIGLTWARIDDNLILRFQPGKTEDTSEARVSIDLKECPMALEEIALQTARSGPLIVNEKTGLPYRAPTFRDAWNADFAKAGLPRGMWERDLRAGGVTEGQRAGSRLEDRAKLAGHAKAKTTADVYDRDVLEAARRVSRARTLLRKNESGI